MEENYVRETQGYDDKIMWMIEAPKNKITIWFDSDKGTNHVLVGYYKITIQKFNSLLKKHHGKIKKYITRNGNWAQKRDHWFESKEDAKNFLNELESLKVE